MIKAFLNNYLPRHRNRVNQLLHLFGVPLTFLGTPIAILNTSTPWWPCAFFVGGYLLQFVGHAVEENDAGEVVFLKKRLGMVYTEYGPGNASSCSTKSDDDTSCN